MTCNAYSLLKLQRIGYKCVQLQILANLLPNLYRNRKTLHRWDTIKRILKSFIRACLWLTFTTGAPGPFLCLFPKIAGKVNFLVLYAVFFASACFIAIDKKAHIYETGLFFAPSMLEQIWNMLEIRGLLGTKKSGPYLTSKQVEDLTLSLSFMVIALVIGINNLSRENK